ncbi:MAG: RluA family pseudouridine synthase [Candidatus Izemoplasmatales bacterium]
MSVNNLEVLYVDNHLLVCVKPAGVLSQEADKDLDDMLNLGKAYIKEKYQKPGNVFLGLVHRLDLNVGGVMVFARTSKAASRLAESIQSHQFSKKYYAVVEGIWLDKNQGELVNYLRKDEQSLTSIEDPHGQLAKLEYQYIESKEYHKEVLSLVEIELITGRFHQIRKQFSLRGHPLYGDQKYGSKTSLQMLPLYAYSLSFPHPISKEILTFKKEPQGKIFDIFK